MTPRERLIFIGSSGHARVAIDIAECMGGFDVVGCLEDFRTVGELTCGYPVLGRVGDLPALVKRHRVDACFIAIGDNAMRSEIGERVALSCPSLALATLLHPSAVIARDVTIGPGSAVMAGAVINPCCSIGRGCIVNTCASIDHDCAIGEYASVAPRVAVGGSCRIGAYTAIGIGAVIRHQRTIGADTVVGAGSTVLSDMPDNVVAFGTPAVPVRARTHGERYL